jgi:hypothetical protein
MDINQLHEISEIRLKKNRPDLYIYRGEFMITDEEVRQYGCSVEYSFLGGGAAFDLDWYRPDQSWRSFRMHRVAGYLRAVADSTGDYALLLKLARICDHKGELTCYWHQLPNDAEKAVLKKAWDSECEDGIFIEHELEEPNVL